MQKIRVGETLSSKTAIHFTSVSSTNVQTRLTGALTIACKIKRAGMTTAATGVGTFTAVDDVGAPGVREYVPGANDVSMGPQVFVFTATGMEPREVPILGVYEDPYPGTVFGKVIAGTLSLSAFTTNLAATETNRYQHMWIRWITGASINTVRRIGASNGGVGRLVTLDTGHTLPALPVVDDEFEILTL